MSIPTHRLWIAGISAVLLSVGFVRSEGLSKGPPWPTGFCTAAGCGACGAPAYRVYRKSNYKPPCYHAGTPFGYYETLWTRWPATHCITTSEPLPQKPAERAPLEVEPLPLPKPIRPDDEAEPLPAPRPLDMTRLFGGPRMPDLLPPHRR
jgi:hypothetical protein